MIPSRYAAFLLPVLVAAAACAESGEPRFEGTPPAGGFEPNEPVAGPPNPTCAATKLAAQTDPLDIVIVVDNSGSMDREMRLIQEGLNKFSAKIASYGIDYRVVLIAWRGTYPGITLCVPPPLGGPDCGNNLPWFSHTDWKVESHDLLQVLLTTYDMQANWGTDHVLPLRAEERWDTRLRADAQKAIVLFSDEEFRTSNAFGPHALNDAAEFDAALLARTPAGMFGTAAKRRYAFHSVINYEGGTSPSSRITCDEDYMEFPDDYVALSTLTQGVVASVCDKNYESNVFDKIAASVRGQLACEIRVPTAEGKVVDPETVALIYTQASGTATPLTRITDASKCGGVPDAWYYDDNVKPTRAILCPDACGRVKAVDAQSLSLEVGCKVPPPR